MRRLGNIVSGMVLASMGASVASATVLEPGGSFVPVGTTGAASPWLSTGLAALNSVNSYTVLNGSGQSLLTGDFIVAIVPMPPFVDRGYCVYVVSVFTSPQGPRQVASIELSGFAGASVDAGFRTDLAPFGGTSPAPSLASRSADGDTVRFDFQPGVSAFAPSRALFVYTPSARLQNTGTARITINTGESVTLTGLPVPTSLASCEGDANADGVINFADLNGVLTNFGEPCP